MTDQEILDLFFERSEQAIEELSAKYGGQLRRTADNILGTRQDAEECVSDALLALWNTIPPRRPDPLPASALRVVRNLAVSRRRFLRAKQRDSAYDLVLDELSEAVPGPGTPEENLDAKELGRSIDRFLDSLSAEDRVLFVRRYYFGDSVSRLAGLLGCRENRLSVRLHRIRGRLRQHLIKEGFVL